MQAIAKLSGSMTEGHWRLTLSGELKKLYLNNFHKNSGANFSPFAGYSMPMNYKNGIIYEHLHVRSFAGVFDVSHMGQILISISEKNILALQGYIPLNLNKIINNKLHYTFMLNNTAGVIDDLIISKIVFNHNEYFYIIYNAGKKKENENIFNSILSNFFYLHDNNLLIAIQGPLSSKVINFLNIPNIYFMESTLIKYKNETLIISRSGYTGEDGFEISIPNIVIENFISDLMKFNKITLCGLGSRDTLRLEAGLCLSGNELTKNITPIEADLNWTININNIKNNNLNGFKNLIHQIKNGVKKIKVGLKNNTKSIIRSKMILFDKYQKKIGFITSGGYSPMIKSSIAIGYIETKHKDSIFCNIRGTNEELYKVKLPFISHNYRRKK